MWWRVELDKTGAILNCELSAGAHEKQRLVTYIEAETKAEACSGATAWYARRLAGYAKNSKTRREKRTREGKCIRCSQPKEATRMQLLLCLRCKALAAEAEARGAGTPRPARNADEQRQAFLATMERCKRRRAQANVSLVGLLERFDAGGPERFREWLVAEIQRRSGRDAEPMAQAAE
jgi:hypothetical protein